MLPTLRGATQLGASGLVPGPPPPPPARPDPLSASFARSRLPTKTIGAPATKQTLVALDGATLIPTTKLPQLRVRDDVEAVRALAAEATLVTALDDAVKPTPPPLAPGGAPRGEGIARMLENRRQRHDASVRAFELFRDEWYAKAEETALALSRDMKAGFKSVNARLDALFAYANDPAVAVAGDEAWLAAQRAGVVALEDERAATLDTFTSRVDGLEAERVAVMGEKLQDLAAVLIDVAHELPPEVHRLIARHSDEVNAIAVENRREAAPLFASLQKAVVAARDASDERWDATDRAWRKVKTEAAIAAYQARINSLEFVNPAERQAQLAALAGALAERHESRRMPLLQELLGLRPPASSSAAVAALRARADALDEEELADSQRRLDDLRSLAERCHADARGLTEGLRRTLHSYLREAGVMETAGGTLAAVVNGEHASPPGSSAPPSAALSREDLMAAQALMGRSTGLRAAMGRFVSDALSDRVIYTDHLNDLRDRLALAVDAAALGPALEAAGKTADRAAAWTALDTLRSCDKKDLPLLLARLARILRPMASLPGLPPAAATELADVSESIRDALEEVLENLNAAGLDVPPLLLRVVGSGNDGAPGDDDGGSAASPRVKFGDTEGAAGGATGGGAAGGRGKSPVKGGAASVARSRAAASGVLASVSGRQTTRTGAGGASTAKTSRVRTVRQPITAEMVDPMATIAAACVPGSLLASLQARVGLVLGASELPTPVLALLRGLLDACGVQAASNAAIDALVTVNCDPLVDKRQLEGVTLLQRVSAFVDAQSTRLSDALARACALMAEVAASAERHEERHRVVDDWVTEGMEATAQAYRSNVARLEAEAAARTVTLRQAPTFDAVEARLAEVMTTLNELQAAYRTQADDTGSWAATHEARVGSVLRVQRAHLSAIFGVALQNAEATDGKALRGEKQSLLPRDGDEGSAGPKDVVPEPTWSKTGAVEAEPPAPAPAPAPAPVASPAGKGAAKPAAPAKGAAAPAPAPAAPAAPPPPPPPAFDDFAVGLQEGEAPLDAVGRAIPGGVTLALRKALQPAASAAAETLDLGAPAAVPVPLPPPDATDALMTSRLAATVAAASTKQGLVLGTRTWARQLPVTTQTLGMSVNFGAATTAAAAAAPGSGAPAPAAVGTAAVVYDVYVTSEQLTRLVLEGDAYVKEASGGGGSAGGAAGAAAAAPAPAAAAPAGGKAKSKKELEAEAAAAKAAEEAAAAAKAAEEAAAAAAAEAAKAAEGDTGVYAKGLRDEAGVPLDPEGHRAAQPLAIPVDELRSLLTALRNDTLRAFEQFASERRRVLGELSKARNTAAAVELGELLRHWAPRPGQVATEVVEPRRGELREHLSRLDRFLRRLGEKDAATDATFSAAVLAARELPPQVLAALQSLKAQLPTQTSIAGIQGLVSKARGMGASFARTFTAALKKAGKAAVDDTGVLLEACKEYVAACPVFEAGGVFHPEELAHHAGAVDAFAQAAAAAAEERAAVVTASLGATAEVEACVAAIAKEAEAAERELSIREGLGPKFGAPRRAASDALRALENASERVAAIIDARLAELRALLAQGVPGSPPTHISPGALPLASETSPVPAGGKVNVSLVAQVIACCEAAVPPPPGVEGSELDEDEPRDIVMDEEVAIAAAAGGLHDDVSPLDVPGGDAPKASAASGAAAPAAGGKAAPAGSAGAKKPPAGGAAPATAAPAVDKAAAAAKLLAEQAERKRLEEVVDGRGPSPLSVRIRRVVNELRDGLYLRAVFLEALKTATDFNGAPRAFALPFVSLADAPPAPPPGSQELPLPPSLPPAREAAPVVLPLSAGAGASAAAGGAPGSAKGKPGAAPGSAKGGAAPAPAPVAFSGTGGDPPHTLKGPAPGRIAATAAKLVPLTECAARILLRCRNDSVTLLVAEKVPGVKPDTKDDADPGLPESLRTFLAASKSRMTSLLEYSRRRFRTQVDDAQALLAAAPPVLVADVAAREKSVAAREAFNMATTLRYALQDLETRRGDHVKRLKAALADPNLVEARQALLGDEAARTQEALELAASTRAASRATLNKLGMSFAARLGYNVVAFMLVADEVLWRGDLMPLPGDEVVAPKKISFKRLHKALRKSTAAGDALVAAAALGDELEALKLGADGEVAGEGAAASSGAPAAGGKGGAPPAKAGSAKGAPAAPVAAAPAQASATFSLPPGRDAPVKDPNAIREWEGLAVPVVDGTPAHASTSTGLALTVAGITTRYGDWSRHAVHARDEACESFQAFLRGEGDSVAKACEAIGTDVAQWQRVWESRTSALGGRSA